MFRNAISLTLMLLLEMGLSLAGSPTTANELADICDAVSNSDMPPVQYRLIHRGSKLSAAEVDLVCRWGRTSGTSSAANNAGH